MATDLYGELESQARTDQAELKAAAERERQESERWHRLDACFCKIYEAQVSRLTIDYREWGGRIATFCELARQEGFTKPFNIEPASTDASTLTALSLIRAGLDGGEAAIAARMAEVQKGREEWPRAFNRDLLDYLTALSQTSGPAESRGCVVTIAKRMLREAIGISERGLAKRIKDGGIRLAESAKPTAKVVKVDINQFPDETKASILKKLGRDT